MEQGNDELKHQTSKDVLADEFRLFLFLSYVALDPFLVRRKAENQTSKLDSHLKTKAKTECAGSEMSGFLAAVVWFGCFLPKAKGQKQGRASPSLLKQKENLRC